MAFNGMILGAALVIVGLLLIAVAARMWSGSYYEDANPRFMRLFPYGTQPWTMPLPMAGYGVVFIGGGALVLLPHAMTGVCVIVVVIGGVAGVTFSIWQPAWSVPPSIRPRR